jgi:hypothetical protein
MMLRVNTQAMTRTSGSSCPAGWSLSGTCRDGGAAANGGLNTAADSDPTGTGSCKVSVKT